MLDQPTSSIAAKHDSDDKAKASKFAANVNDLTMPKYPFPSRLRRGTSQQDITLSMFTEDQSQTASSSSSKSEMAAVEAVEHVVAKKPAANM